MVIFGLDSQNLSHGDILSDVSEVWVSGHSGGR